MTDTSLPKDAFEERCPNCDKEIKPDELHHLCVRCGTKICTKCTDKDVMCNNCHEDLERDIQRD